MCVLPRGETRLILAAFAVLVVVAVCFAFVLFLILILLFDWGVFRVTFVPANGYSQRLNDFKCFLRGGYKIFDLALDPFNLVIVSRYHALFLGGNVCEFNSQSENLGLFVCLRFGFLFVLFVHIVLVVVLVGSSGSNVSSSAIGTDVSTEV